MASNIVHYPNFSIVEGDVKVNIDFGKVSDRINQAQYWLDNQIMTDMVPMMPHQTGTFVNLTRARSASVTGTGMVYAAAGPYGRFQYMGKVMVDPTTNSPWARKDAKKILIDKNLTYSNPQAVPRWFDEAKKLHGQEWIQGVSDIIGGKNGRNK